MGGYVLVMVMGKKRRLKIWSPRIAKTPFGWSVDWWDHGHHQRRFKVKEGAEAYAAELKAERAAAEAGERKQRAIVRANVRRGDVAVDLLNLPPADKVAVAQAIETLRAAGGTPEDLPAAAKEYADRHLSEYRATLGEVLKKHLEDMEALGRAKDTLRERRWRCGKLVDALGADKRISTIGRTEIAEWVASAPAGSRRNHYAAAAAFFKWAWLRGYMAEYPMAALPKPALQKNGEASILTPDQVRKLLETALQESPSLTSYIALGVFAGLRPLSELVWVKWEDIDFAEKKIFVVSRKTGRARPVPISDNLAAWLALTPKEKRTGLAAPFSRRAWRQIQKSAEVHVGHDVLRHTRCSYRLALLRDPGIVAAEGGHQLAVLQRHYANLRIKEEECAEFWGIMPPKPTSKRPAKTQ